MENKKINYLLVVMLLVITSILSILSFNKREDALKKEDFTMIEIPYELNGWLGKDVKLDEEVFEILGTKRIIMRQYKNSNDDIIWLYLVCSEKNRTSFHPPEYCYLGSGKNELLEKETASTEISDETLSFNRLIFQTQGGLQMVLFWFTADKEMFASYYKQQLRLLLNTIRNKKSEGIMVRLSTYFNPENEEERFEMMRLFIKDLMPYLRT